MSTKTNTKATIKHKIAPSKASKSKLSHKRKNLEIRQKSPLTEIESTRRLSTRLKAMNSQGINSIPQLSFSKRRINSDIEKYVHSGEFEDKEENGVATLSKKYSSLNSYHFRGMKNKFSQPVKSLSLEIGLHHPCLVDGTVNRVSLAGCSHKIDLDGQKGEIAVFGNFEGPEVGSLIEEDLTPQKIRQDEGFIDENQPKIRSIFSRVDREGVHLCSLHNLDKSIITQKSDHQNPHDCSLSFEVRKAVKLRKYIKMKTASYLDAPTRAPGNRAPSHPAKTALGRVTLPTPAFHSFFSNSSYKRPAKSCQQTHYSSEKEMPRDYDAHNEGDHLSTYSRRKRRAIDKEYAGEVLNESMIEQLDKILQYAEKEELEEIRFEDLKQLFMADGDRVGLEEACKLKQTEFEVKRLINVANQLETLKSEDLG